MKFLHYPLHKLTIKEYLNRKVYTLESFKDVAGTEVVPFLVNIDHVLPIFTLLKIFVYAPSV